MDDFDHLDFELDDYLMLGIISGEDSSSSFVTCPPQTQNSSQNVCTAAASSSVTSNIPRSSDIDEGKRVKKRDGGNRVVFRTKSSIEIMDDGFKWRKYGKKKVKTSPYPRNYYRCSSKGCDVKKRVERDCEDSSFVVTTYDGKHNHHSPTANCVLCYHNHNYNEMLPFNNNNNNYNNNIDNNNYNNNVDNNNNNNNNGWTFQPSQHQSLPSLKT